MPAFLARVYFMIKQRVTIETCFLQVWHMWVNIKHAPSINPSKTVDEYAFKGQVFI